MIYSGKFKVTSPFGTRVLNGKRDNHMGIDVVGITDKHVCAVAPGVVGMSVVITDKSNRTWEWGEYVRVDGDDGYKYYYCHMDKRLVRNGQRVKVGDHLGIEGNTGYSFGTHCHFEVRDKNGKSVDPSTFLGVENRCGEYGEDYRALAEARFGLSADTLKYLDKYKYAADLYRKLADAE